MMRLLWRRLYLAALFSAGILSIFSPPALTSAGDFDGVFTPPVVLKDRTVRYLARFENGRWALSSRSVSSPTVATPVPLSLDAAYADLRLFVDGKDQLWLAGEENRPGEVLIRIGRLDGVGFGESRMIGVPAGWNGRADLAFAGTAEPWVAWRYKSGSIEEILVEDTSTGLRWRLTSPDASALSAPRIRADRTGGIWVLWTGMRGERYIVAGRRFDGRSWSEETLIADNGDRPCLQLDAGSAGDGILRIAWSAFNGQFYRIQTAAWTAGSWSEPRELTRHAEMETAPRIISGDRGVEAVVWAGLRASDRRIWACETSAGSASAPFVVSDTAGSLVFEAAGTGEEIFLITESPEGPRFQSFRRKDGHQGSISRGEKPGRPGSSPAQPSGPAISTRLETEYIGFGDSITFGYINRQEAPDRGYIPRLDLKLDAAFGPTTVVNSGFPGEYTIEGLARIDSVLAAQRGRYLLLMEGTNDVKHVDTPIPTSLYNLREICKRCLTAGVIPLLATVIPRRDDIWEFEYYQGRHFDLEAGIRALAPSLVIPLVEMEQPFMDYPGGPDNLLSDYVHPNETGYAVMTGVWYAAIRALPFPPVNLDILVKSKSTAQAAEGDPAKNGSAVGYLLSWEPSPKTADIASIKGYRIYRKKASEGASSFVLIGHVEGVFAYLDRSVDGTTVYDYVISTVAVDNVEGTASAMIRR